MLPCPSSSEGKNWIQFTKHSLLRTSEQAAFGGCEGRLHRPSVGTRVLVWLLYSRPRASPGLCPACSSGARSQRQRDPRVFPRVGKDSPRCLTHPSSCLFSAQPRRG